MTLADLAVYLGEHAESILERWCAEVSRDPQQPANRHRLSGDALRDHLPSLLEAFARRLRDESVADVDKEGAEHGRQRRVHGYTVGELMDEMRLFRRTLMAALDEFRAWSGMSDATHAAARLRILELIDDSLRASVEQYIEEAEAERDLARARLEQRSAELDESNAQKDRFLSMLSHELRNPLSPILTAVQVLQRLGVQDPSFERQRAIIERQATHLGKLVNDLLDVNRIAHGKIDLQPQIIDVRDSVRLAAESCRPAIVGRGVRFAVQLPDEPLCVFADPTRMVQVITNLLVNAGKFTERGGRIDLTVRKNGGEAVVALRDTGIGIAPEMLPRLFEMFSQAETSLQRDGSGMGIGLSVAKNLIEMQGGRIEARSEGLGRGAEFVIHMPLSLVRRPAAEPELPRRSRSPGRRVAVVEDNDDSREALGAALEIFGHEVAYARSAEEALALAHEQAPDAFVIDIGLPGMDGYQLAQRLRRLQETRRATLIALSGFGSLADKQRAEQAGFDAHLTKPADVERVHALLAGEPRRANE